jgi:hypothetical protein
MIKAAMVINNHGKARLLKFYEKLVRLSRSATLRPFLFHTFRFVFFQSDL